MEDKFIEAQQSVVAGMERQTASRLFDVMNPADFSRESIMFVRYAVDCCGVRVFDLPPAEVQRLWLAFCVQFNTGSELTPDWYESTAVRDSADEGYGGGALMNPGAAAATNHRLIRLDATTWPSLDRPTSHDWNLTLTDEQRLRGREAAKLSAKTAQSHWKSFFTGRPGSHVPMQQQ